MSIDPIAQCWERLGWLAGLANREKDPRMRQQMVEGMVHEASCIAASRTGYGEEEEASDLAVRIVTGLLRRPRSPDGYRDYVTEA